LLRDDPGAKFTLVAGRNLPDEIRVNQVWDDDMSTLVGLSGEPLSIYGEPLKRFKTSNLGQSILLVPITIQKHTVGALGLSRKTAQTFTDSDQQVVKAVAEYTAQALLNLRLLRGYEERTRSLQRIAETAQAGEKAKAETLLNISHELRSIEEAALACLRQVVEMPQNGISANARQSIFAAQEKLAQAVKVIDLVFPLAQSNLSSQAPASNACDIARQVIPRFQRRAQQQSVTLLSELPGESILVRSDPAQLYQILEGLVANAVRVSLPGGKITLRVERGAEKLARFTVRDSGPGIEARDLPHIFERKYYKEDNTTSRPAVDGISLPLIKELISAYGGTIWVESKLGQGSAFQFTLPAAR
jgi:signal transduction histidine kinase